MGSIFSSELHKFVKYYFDTVGAKIVENHADSFTVVFPEGKKQVYTYSPRTASENKEMVLLAKGSKALRAMIQECNSQAAFSEVAINYSEDSIKALLCQKTCCELCPFIAICKNSGTCCDFCYNYRSCNTIIENADFIGLGDTISKSPTDLICFVFSVELSNDYSLSQKIEKTVTVLINLATGEVINNILIKDINLLDMLSCESTQLVNAENYPRYLKTARHEAENILKEQLDVFKKEIEEPLMDKILAITNKFEEDYIENYTKYTLEQLEQFQNEGLKLCEREIRGYTINNSYHLKNVIVMHTGLDVRNLVFRLKRSETEIQLPAEIFLSRINIKCTQCGMEIDTGVICSDGHILCRNCSEICSVCGKVICDTCDHETHVCSTCGEVICSDCIIKCSSCDAVLCASHAYYCSDCGKAFCIDCYEICHICGNNVCNDHLVRCNQCNEPVCSEHIHACSVCNKLFCDNHIESCIICGDLLCEEHAYTSAYSGRTVCSNHHAVCAVCGDTFAKDEIKSCNVCGEELCPAHIKECAVCGKVYCSKHINHCKSCGEEVCDCTVFQKCKLCGEEYCPNCINSKGYCKACEELDRIDIGDKLVVDVIKLLPELEKYNKFYLGSSKEIKVLYAKGLLNGHLIILSHRDEVLSHRDIAFIDNLKIRVQRRH